MKAHMSVLTLVLLVGCAQKTAESAPATAAAPTPTPAVQSPAPTPEPAAAAVSASAHGVVTAVDATAQTVTISHEPVESLQWPAMTMTFHAPGVDVSQLKAGDEIDFEFTSTGTDGTITAIKAR